MRKRYTNIPVANCSLPLQNPHTAYNATLTENNNNNNNSFPHMDKLFTLFLRIKEAL